ncbi:hypothetical protein JXQ70_17565, partial [bacterium]|nr:hypothetical protein [bacterium]
DLFNTAPSVGTIFNDIDVTAAVYEDLFGAVPAQNYSGFVIDCDSNSGKGTIVFDNDLPSLRIIIDEPEVPTLSILGILVLCCFFSLFALLRTLKNEKS